MNITPIEIRQKEFERHFRGYDKDEVNAFLHTLSQAWERLLQENREKTARLEQAEKDVEKVREVEGSLFRTLRTAEDTSSEIVSKAQRTADEISQEAERRRQQMIEEAHRRASAMVRDAEAQADAIVRGVRERVEQLKQEATEVEGRRQLALTQLQELAQQIMQQVENAPPPAVDDAIEESERLLIEAEEAAHHRAALHQENAEGDPPQNAAHLSSDERSSPEEHAAYESYEASPEATEAKGEYEPAWASEENEADTAPEPLTARLKRGSFFDEID